MHYDRKMFHPTDSDQALVTFKLRLGTALLVALGLAAIDLLIKYWVYLHVNLRPGTDFGNIERSPSTGFVNQTLTGGQSFAPLIFIGLPLGCFLLFYLLSAIPGKLSWLSITLLLAAIFGNGPERLLTGGVIDYWILPLPNHLYLIINLADLLVLGGTILMPFYLWRHFRDLRKSAAPLLDSVVGL